MPRLRVVASLSGRSCCSQVLTGRCSCGLAATQLGEDVQGDHDPDVNEAKQHDRRGPELPAGSVLCKECKLVSLILCVALLSSKPAALIGGLGPSKGTLASSFLL